MTTTHESTAAWHELLDTLRDLDTALPRGRPRRRRRPARRRRLPAAGHDARRRVRHLPVRRAEPADLRRAQHAVPPRPALGRRQHRRLLPARAGRRPTAATGSPATGATRSTSRSPATTSPPPAPGRTRSCCTCTTPTWTSTRTATSPSRSGPVPDIAALVTRDYQLDAAVGPPGHLAHRGPRGARTRSGTATRRRPPRCGPSAAWLRTMFVIIPLTIGVRAEEQQTEGHEIANAANTMGPPYQVPDSNFGWSARDACYSFGSLRPRRGRGAGDHAPAADRAASGASCVWNQFMANHTAGDGRTSVNIGIGRRRTRTAR